MSYQSPIEAFYNDIEYRFEDAVFKAIQKVDIKVDRNELIKALEYDRAQYDKGYSDGRFDRDREIVRCGECKNCGDNAGEPEPYFLYCFEWLERVDENGYCYKAERKNEVDNG